MLLLKLLQPGALTIGLSLGCIFAGATHPAHGAESALGQSGAARPAAPKANEDCFALGDVEARELCFS